MGVGKILSRGGGALVDFFKRFSEGGPEVVKFIFYHSKLRKQTFAEISNSCPPSDTHACV